MRRRLAGAVIALGLAAGSAPSLASAGGYTPTGLRIATSDHPGEPADVRLGEKGAPIGPLADVGEGQHALSVSGEARSVGGGPAGTAIQFECDAIATPTAVATSIDTCTLSVRTRACSTCDWSDWTTTDALTTPVSFPGPAATATGIAVVGSSAGGTQARLCVAASAVFAETVLGPGVLATSSCSNLLVA